MVTRSQTFLLNFVFLFFVAFAGLNSAASATGPSCAQLFSNSATHSSKTDELFDKILGLSAYATIPNEIYDEYSINEIGRAIVNRIHVEEEKVSFAKGSAQVDLMANSDIIVFFHPRDFQSIEEKGFLNQHQVPKSSGSFIPVYRKRVENTLVGLNLGYENSALELRPKFAFLNIKEEKELARKQSSLTKYYGSIGAVLKQNIKDRATWATADTNRIVIHNIGYETKSETVRLHHGTFNTKRIPTGLALDMTYYEAQIWGNLSFVDVDFFIIMNKEDLQLLAHSGKPVYLAKEVSKFGRIIYEKGELLLDGSKIEVTKEELPIPPLEQQVEKLNTNSFQDTLQSVGIREAITSHNLLTLGKDNFKVTQVITTLDDYYIYTKARERQTFDDYISELKISASILTKKGFKTKKIIHSTDQFIIQEGRGTDTELSAIPASSRKQIMEPLKQLVLKMVENKLYLKGLRPSMISIDSTGELVIRGHEGLREKESAYETAKRFEEKLLPHWGKYFDQIEIQDLREYLKALKDKYREGKAS